MNKRRLPLIDYRTLAIAFFLCAAHLPNARADSASCTAKLSEYVVELDQLLLKEKNWIRPFKDLNQKYFPLRDCEGNSLLQEVQRSGFLVSKSYNAKAGRYFFVFSNGDVETGFTYLISDGKSEFDYAMFTRK
jgi:hypothetical protein